MTNLLNNIFEIRVFIDAIGSIQAVIFAVYFFYKAKEDRIFFYFGLFLLIYSSGLFIFILDFFNFYKQYPKLRYLPIDFNYLSTPLIYLYVFKVSILKKDKLNKIIFLPALIEFLIGIIMLLASSDSYIFNIVHQIIYSPAYYLFIPYDLLMAILIINLINKHNKIVKEQYSNMQITSLDWVRTIVFIQILFLIIYAFYIFVPVFGKYTNFIDIFLTVMNVLYVYWMSIKGLEQKTINSFIEINKSKTTDEKSKKKSNTLSKEYINDNFSIINEIILENKLYTNTNLTIIDIAKVVKIHQKKISQIINSYTKQNFNSYINNFRVAEAQRMLKDNQYNNLSIDGIGMKSGFNSKSAFYRAFKNSVGLTPKGYKKALNKK